ncbi:MAG: redox-regulated ATPase YchF [Candidatus Sungbacteria bacterium RIFCSPLOWO2_01_FULL_60_25]|uniref:Ribosome-binding ATPase YchF n=1 Tax=Candidatus Sungbacteria bacterium RIFCSPLOWO2_01_FULL_60_25 TaxID=1802281 RepID=A0A1G2LA79_9BACT|nr:MAG: redox-regulated ATPase YchF [Candidatus Sungbacteria bacterium RIFCSPLOWO2_01_FULL_60_25]
MQIGIIGLPNVGKSTLFRALTKKQVAAENYPFVTIEPNVGVVKVPDERVEKLAELSHSAKKIHAVVEFVDIAGLVKGAAEGEGLGNKFLSHIREVDAIAEVVRVFEDPDIIHVENRVDPKKDIEIIDLELILKDLDTVEKRLEGAIRQARGGDKAAVIQKEVLDRIREGLESGKRAVAILGKDEREEVIRLMSELSLLTAKPRIVVFNASEEQIQKKWEPSPELCAALGGDPWLALSAKVEDELNSLAPEEKTEYLKTLGLEQSGLDRMIQIGYETLCLITFLTTGEDETRAWTIPKGSAAPRAGRAIHSDFEQKFIRAEVIAYERIVEAGSFARGPATPNAAWAKAREFGWIRIEGKEYVVQDGDVIEFRI